ncbi:uncharacterized protein KD926_003939 [Aspergillus affinis]|uniref:uncharacterized protein n=1 Tax=Aspergillus affinis TaxID=1070780 RepID=UPI0022FE9045|nr:uncharacterized protein KD926_003939 [Aspergillus affinis]KAI9046101.1 hypothetical protein KD926_003939 [Aspergillus affinis]
MNLKRPETSQTDNDVTQQGTGDSRLVLDTVPFSPTKPLSTLGGGSGPPLGSHVSTPPTPVSREQGHHSAAPPLTYSDIDNHDPIPDASANIISNGDYSSSGKVDQGDIGRSNGLNNRLGRGLRRSEKNILGSDCHMIPASPNQVAQLPTGREHLPSLVVVVPPPPRRKSFAVAHAFSEHLPTSPPGPTPMSTPLPSAGPCNTRDIFGRAILTIDLTVVVPLQVAAELVSCTV